MINRIKKRVYEILECSKDGDYVSKYFDTGIMALIVLNVLAVILETVDTIASPLGTFFIKFETFSVIIFSLEYLGRLWVADMKYKKATLPRLAFVRSPMAIIDFLAVVPFYLPMFITVDLRFVRILRMFRLFRIFKMGRYMRSMQVIGKVLRQRKEQLMITLFLTLLLIIFSASIMYAIENEAQPEAFSSIPEAMWWGMATLTTVGYGDIYPVTLIGKFLAGIIALMGIGLVALPTGIVASGFNEALEAEMEPQRCPHCKKELE